jgi:hypothetical protein
MSVGVVMFLSRSCLKKAISSCEGWTQPASRVRSRETRMALSSRCVAKVVGSCGTDTLCLATITWSYSGTSTASENKLTANFHDESHDGMIHAIPSWNGAFYDRMAWSKPLLAFPYPCSISLPITISRTKVVKVSRTTSLPNDIFSAKLRHQDIPSRMLLLDTDNIKGPRQQ